MNQYNLVFSGQGAQFIGMGHDFYDQFSESRNYFDRASDILGTSISDIAFNGPEATLNQTQYTQVAIFVLSACIFDQLQKNHPAIHQLAGHSLGEITAYYAAGVLDFESAVNIVIKRGQLMALAANHPKGAMSAIIGLSQPAIEDLIASIDGVGIANYNSPVQFVISGTAPAVEQANTAATALGAKRVVPLPVSGAFHSPLMASAVAPFKEYLTQFTFNNANYPIVLNRLATPETSGTVLEENLSLQIQAPVRWIESIEHLASNCPAFIEVGPGKVLSGLIKKINRTYKVSPTSTVAATHAIINTEDKYVV
jgi:[acyl-carrier-protein] S-malonyltransferase